MEEALCGATCFQQGAAPNVTSLERCRGHWAQHGTLSVPAHSLIQTHKTLDPSVSLSEQWSLLHFPILLQ